MRASSYDVWPFWHGGIHVFMPIADLIDSEVESIDRTTRILFYPDDIDSLFIPG
ncbi:hypothetical protein MYA_0219 [Burkholderia sp. KJ006]|nr:hypothetical protein MYA_0219 [Burkholderia sp. KJ006]